MKQRAKLLFACISVVLVTVGVLAIITETQTSASRFEGIRTAVGDDAVWAGKTFLILAMLPMMVWLPKRWVGLGVADK
jgi:hypothetical protein